MGFPTPGPDRLPWLRAHVIRSSSRSSHSPPLTLPAAAAMVARETAALLSRSTRARSIRPPWLGSAAASVWLCRCRWSVRGAADPNQITTPIGHRFSPEQTITVLDPRHHLYGQILPLVALTHHTQLGRCCVVWLQPHGERLVPVRATTLAFLPPHLNPSPFSIPALYPFLL